MSDEAEAKRMDDAFMVLFECEKDLGSSPKLFAKVMARNLALVMICLCKPDLALLATRVAEAILNAGVEEIAKIEAEVALMTKATLAGAAHKGKE